MLPGIIKTYPENESKGVSLEDKIRLVFDQKIDHLSVTPDNVRVINVNTNETVTDDYHIELAGDLMTVEVIPLHSMPYRTDFKIEVSNIVSWSLERMFGTYELFFETKDGVVDEDGNVDEGEIPESGGNNGEAVHPVAPEYTVTPKLSLNGKYLTSNKIYVELEAVDEYGIKANEVYINAPEFNYGSIFMVLNEGYSSYEEAFLFGDKIPICSPGNTYIFKNKIVMDLDKADTEIVKLESGVSYYLAIGEIPVSIDDIEEHVSKPNGKELMILDPMYATIQSVLSYFSMLGMDKFINIEDIAYRIYENSKLAEYIVQEAENENITFEPPSMALVNFVAEKTKYDIMFAKYVSMSSSAQRKVLDAMEIEYKYTLADLMNMLDKLKKNYDKWEDILSGNKKAKSATFNKGADVDQMPDYIKSREMKGW